MFAKIAVARAPVRCNVVQNDAATMIPMQNFASIQNDKQGQRLSVSLTVKQHEELNELARKNRVSIAWVVREAIDRLLKDDQPLLHMRKE